MDIMGAKKILTVVFVSIVLSSLVSSAFAGPIITDPNSQPSITKSITNEGITGASDPSPQIIEVSCPPLVYYDQKATITVTAKNNGGFSDAGYISVSFPNDEYILESDVYGTGNAYNKPHPKGSLIWNSTGQQMVSVDTLVELCDTNWGEGQEESITMSVSPTCAEQIVFYVRVALKNSEGTYIRTPTYSDQKDQQGWYVYKYTIDIVYPPLVAWTNKTEGNVRSVGISSDGNYIVAGSTDKNVYLFDKTGNLKWKEPLDGPVYHVAISNDGNYIVAGSDDSVYYFDKDQNLLWKKETGDWISSVSVSDNGDYVAFTCFDGYVYYFDKTGFRWRYETKNAPSSVRLSSDGEKMAVLCWDWVYYFDKNGFVWDYEIDTYWDREISISSDGEYIGVAAGWAYYFDKNRNLLWSFDPDQCGNSVKVSSDGEYVVLGSGSWGGGNGYVYYFSKDSNIPIWKKKTTHCVHLVDMPRDANYILAASMQTFTLHYFKTNGDLLWESPFHANSAKISSDGNYIAMGAGECIFFLDAFVELQIPLEYSPASLATGDLNKSGLNDLVVSGQNLSNGNPVMNLYNQQNDHTFLEQEFFDNDEIASLSVGDLDDNGFDDIASLYGYISTEGAYSRVRVWYQNEAGFGSYSDYTFTGLHPKSLAVDDLNDDESDDIAIIADNSICIFYQQPDHTFHSTPDYTLNWGYSSWPWSITTGDINNDGLIDIAVGHFGLSFSDSGISFFYQTESHSFVAAPFDFVDINSMLSCSIGDLNNDKLNDVAIARSGMSIDDVLIYYQKEDYTFNFWEHPQDADKIILTNSPVSISVCDLNDDGLDDIAVGNRDSKMISIYYSKPLSPVELALNQYQQRVNRFFDDYAQRMAESDARLYKEFGEGYSNSVINYYGYKADKISGTEIPAKFKDAMDFITQNTSYNNKTRTTQLYYFYNEMFSAVNTQMSEEQIINHFYAYYLGTAPNQQYFFFGEKGFKQILDDYDTKHNLHKQQFLDNINSSDLSENDLNNIVMGISMATNSIEEYNKLFNNFDDISDAYINGDVTDVKLVRNKENIIFTVPLMLGIYLGGAIITSHGAAYVTSVYAPVIISGVTAYTHQILSVDSFSFSSLTNQPATSTLLRGFDRDNIQLLMNEFFVRKMQIEAYNRANDFDDFVELIDGVEDLYDIEIIELYAPDITSFDPVDPSGTMGKQQGYIEIRNNGMDPVKVDLDIYIKASYSETTISDSSIVLSPSETKTVNFCYSVNLEELEEDGVCGLYPLTAQVTYKMSYSPLSIGIEVLQPGTFFTVDTPLSIPLEFPVDEKTTHFWAYDASDSSFQNLISNTEVEEIAEDQISEGNEKSYNVNVPSDSDRTVFKLNYPGSDLDLHLYDQFENHVGLNYDTGQVETQISGVAYSGSDSNPEWIRIEGHQNEQFELKTIALSTLGNESFSIHSINTKEVPAILSIKPPKISLTGYVEESITQNIIISEYGGFNDLNAISITTSDLTDGMGCVIPFSNLTFDMPSTDISAGSVMIVNLTIDIPPDVVEGRTYSGIITAEDASGAIDNISVNVAIQAPKNILTVDDSGGADYTRIQDAVNNASSGYIIKVFPGNYNENVVINKSLKLIGEDKNTTIIGGWNDSCVSVIANNVEISGFTLSCPVFVYSSYGCIIDGNIMPDNTSLGGITLINLEGCTITHNILSSPGGITISNSVGNTIAHNVISLTTLGGISLFSSINNTIHDNDLSENSIGIYSSDSNNNLIYHNNFIDNIGHAYDNTGTNQWDNGPTGGGNYWSGHSCTGNPSDGSQPFIIDSDGVDYYPFQDKDGWLKESKPPIFDTGSPSNSYPSIFGTHNGTIKTNHTITVQKLYTYPCAGTGGHTEYARIWNNSGLDRFATWSGYKGDWHNITFNETFVLYKNKTYNYTIRTGSYPQIIHKLEHTTLDGSFINCTSFVDANGKRYNNWIPAIKLE